MIIDNTKPLQEWSPSLRGLMKQIAIRMSPDNPDKWLTRVWVSERSDIRDFNLTEQDIKDIANFFDIHPRKRASLFEWADEIAARI